MSDLLDKAFSVASQPASDAWRRVSDQVLQRRGAATYEAPLVPGFDGLEAEDVLMLPSEEQYREQVARGEDPRYEYENQALANQKDLKRAKGIISRLAKLGTENNEYMEGGVEPYSVVNTNTTDRDYSAERDRHVREGIDIAWSGNANVDRTSETSTPSILNQSLRGGPQ